MPTAAIDGLKVNFHVQGSGPHLLMLAPGGFNSTIRSWMRGGVGDEGADAQRGILECIAATPERRQCA